MRRRPASGVTLMEVLLVTVLLVVIAALAVPNLRSSFSGTRLRKGADVVRGEWARARVQAIKSGQVHVFRHLLGSDGFITTPQFSLDDVLESDQRYLTQSFDGSTVGVGGLGITNEVSRLPEQVVFMGADVAMDQRSESQMLNYETGSNQGFGTAQTGAAEWGMPIFFFPDGTASSARVVLRNEQNQAISIEMRGMTGIARVGIVQPASEIQALESTQ